MAELNHPSEKSSDVKEKIIEHYTRAIQKDLKENGIKAVDFKENGIAFNLKYHRVDVSFKITEK